MKSDGCKHCLGVTGLWERVCLRVSEVVGGVHVQSLLSFSSASPTCIIPLGSFSHLPLSSVSSHGEVLWSGDETEEGQRGGRCTHSGSSALGWATPPAAPEGGGLVGSSEAEMPCV